MYVCKIELALVVFIHLALFFLYSDERSKVEYNERLSEFAPG